MLSSQHLQHLKKFVTDLEELIPNATYYKRKRVLIRNFIDHAKENEFTDLIIVTEKGKKPGARCLRFFVLLIVSKTA